jgi:osmotically-inducible protein OsmY
MLPPEDARRAFRAGAQPFKMAVVTMTAMTRKISVLCLAATVILGAAALQGCVGAAVGGAATVGVAAYQERGIDGVAQDFKLATEIRTKWIDYNHLIPTKVSVEVYEGRALLTGVVQDEPMRADAVRLAWQVVGIKEVLNEIQVAKSGTVIDFSRDAWITGQLKSRITFDEKIMAVNYHVETVNGTIYLIGIAQTQDELDRVVATARSIGYVRNIVSHVRVKTPTTKG